MSYKLPSINSYLFIYLRLLYFQMTPTFVEILQCSGACHRGSQGEAGDQLRVWTETSHDNALKLVLQLSDNIVLLQSACPQEPRRKRFLWCWQGIHFLIILKFLSQASTDDTILTWVSLKGRFSDACQDWLTNYLLLNVRLWHKINDVIDSTVVYLYL